MGPEELEEFRRILSSVKRLSSWLDNIITITTMDPDFVTFTGTMGKGYTSTPMPEAPVDYNLDEILYSGGAFGTITQTAVPAAPVDYNLDESLHLGGAFGTITQTAVPAAG